MANADDSRPSQSENIGRTHDPHSGTQALAPAEDGGAARPDQAHCVSMPVTNAQLAHFARYLLWSRRNRSVDINPIGTSDPVWDMILDLYAAAVEGARVCVTDLCLATDVPTTTALRWIATMEKRGDFCRSNDTRDGRRKYISLSATFMQSVECHLVASWLRGRALFSRAP